MTYISSLYIPVSAYESLRTYAGLIGSNVHDELNAAIRDFLGRPDARDRLLAAKDTGETQRLVQTDKLAKDLHGALRRAAFDYTSPGKNVSVSLIAGVAVLCKLEKDGMPLKPVTRTTAEKPPIPATPATPSSPEDRLRRQAKKHKGLRL